MKRDWKAHALACTEGTQFGAILRAAMKLPDRTPPYFGQYASITSDGFIMCDFCDKDGVFHIGAFVGAADDLDGNVAGLTKHMSLTAQEHAELQALIRGWISVDYRSLLGGR